MKKWLWVLISVPVLVLGGAAALFGVVMMIGIGAVSSIFGSDGDGGDGCWADGPSIAVSADIAQLGSVAGYSGEQLENAATIISVGQQRDVPVRGQTIAVATAMGESSLRNIDYGDDIHGVRNPDGSLTCSLGLFQQQWCLGWGTREEVLDPVYSSGKFYSALLAVDGWQQLEPTIASHKAQRNRDPYHYARYWEPAQQVLAALTGLPEQQTTQPAPFATPGLHLDSEPDEPHEFAFGGMMSDLAPCAASATGISAGPDGWVSPAPGPITSGFGPRRAPTAGASTFHKGVDIGASCRTTMYAAADGVVTYAGLTGYAGGNAILIDHGGGIVTRYAHILTGSFQVRVGDTVTAGQPIAGVGGDPRLDPQGAGTSTGCHLHFEVQLDGTPVDPVPYLAERGVILGA